MIGWTREESHEGVYLDPDLLAWLGSNSFDLVLTACPIGDDG